MSLKYSKTFKLFDYLFQNLFKGVVILSQENIQSHRYFQMVRIKLSECFSDQLLTKLTKIDYIKDFVRMIWLFGPKLVHKEKPLF